MTNHATRAGACALFLLTLQQGAQAQSNLTLYGVVDAGVLAARQGGSTMTKVESGVGATSRWGVMGTEDLGGGLSASFQLESFFRSDSGVAGSTTLQGDASFWSRQSNISLKSREWGEIKIGRQLPAQVSPAYDTFAGVSGFSPYASLSSIGRDQGAGATVGDSRISRAVSYQSPERHALGGAVLVATRNSTAPNFPRLSAYGTEVHYTSGKLSLQGQYMANKTDPTATVPTFRNDWWGLGVQYRGDGVTASYIFNALVPKKAGYLKSQTHALGFTIPWGKDTIRISPVYRAVQGRSDLNSFALGLGYDHNLSKRTTVYARAGYVANRRNAIATLSTGTLAKAGDDMPVAAVGIYTRF